MFTGVYVYGLFLEGNLIAAAFSFPTTLPAGDESEKASLSFISIFCLEAKLVINQ